MTENREALSDRGSRHPRDVEVVVRVHVIDRDGDPKRIAVDMVKEALALRPASSQYRTFVSEGSVHAR